jgi:hypothetical protein
MTKQPDPSPPPKASQEERQFKSLLRRLVAVPKGELDDKMAERKRRKRRG